MSPSKTAMPDRDRSCLLTAHTTRPFAGECPRQRRLAGQGDICRNRRYSQVNRVAENEGDESRGSESRQELVHRLAVGNEVDGSTKTVGDRRQVRIKAEQLIHRREDVLRIGRTLDRVATLLVGGADDLAGADAGAEEHAPIGARPVLAAPA